MMPVRRRELNFQWRCTCGHQIFNLFSSYFPKKTIKNITFSGGRELKVDL
jgi:hypothetical protein